MRAWRTSSAQHHVCSNGLATPLAHEQRRRAPGRMLEIPIPLRRHKKPQKPEHKNKIPLTPSSHNSTQTCAQTSVPSPVGVKTTDQYQPKTIDRALKLVALQQNFHPPPTCRCGGCAGWAYPSSTWPLACFPSTISCHLPPLLLRVFLRLRLLRPSPLDPPPPPLRSERLRHLQRKGTRSGNR